MTKFGARVAAEMAGQNERVLFAHYRGIVSVESANEFWAIAPSLSETSNP